MNYKDDIRGRYWTVTVGSSSDDSDPWDLRAGDLLVFKNSDTAENITRVRAVVDTAGEAKLESVIWGINCRFGVNDTNQGMVDGEHPDPVGVNRPFSFKINPPVAGRKLLTGGPTRASHPETTLSSTWMADEGP